MFEHYSRSVGSVPSWVKATFAVTLLTIASLDFAMGETLAIATPSKDSLSRSSESVSTERYSSAWGLSSVEWQQYQQIMESRRGVWSPGLDPLSALGVSANTTSERRRFAELYVRAEFERVRKELAFQIEVDQAWKRLYPDTPRLLDVARSSTATRPIQRYAVVVSADCTTCEKVIKDRLNWLAKTQSGEPVDVHVVGTGGDDSELRAWVKKNHWLEQALKSKRATLNHGDQFADLSQFPVVYAQKEGGQWAREL